MHRILAAVLALVLAGPVLAAAPVRDTLIVPGERVGPISLGMNSSQLTEAAGAPAQVQQQGTTTIYSWGTVAAEIADPSSGVDVITVNDPGFETAGHLRVGLAGLLVIAVLGAPQNRTSTQGLDTLDYDGLTVVVRNNLIAQIRVKK